MRAAGLVDRRALEAVKAAVRPGVSTGELDADRRGPHPVPGRRAELPRLPRFHRRRSAPRSTTRSCTASRTPSAAGRGRQHLLDCGAILQGWHSDSAVTVTVGEVSPEDAALMERDRALDVGRAGAGGGRRPADRHQRRRRAASVTAEGPYGIVDHYGGHGIGTEMHQDPHVLNYGRPGRGPELVPGLALAIEPMVTVGDPATVELDDGWTVVTKDGSRAAHFEHTVAITPEGPWC